MVHSPKRLSRDRPSLFSTLLWLCVAASGSACLDTPVAQRNTRMDMDKANDNVSVARGSTSLLSAPRARLIIVAGPEGTVEACGCGGEAQTSLDRLAAAITAAQAEDLPSLVIALDQLFASVGDQRPARAQDALSAALLRDLLPRMGIAVAAPALSDFQNAGTSLATLRGAGVSLLAPPSWASMVEPPALGRSALRRVGSLTIGIVTAADSAPENVLNDELRALRAGGAQVTLAIVSASQHAQPTLWGQASAPDIILMPAPDGAEHTPHVRVNGESKLLFAPARAQGLLLIDVAAPSSGAAELRVQPLTVKLTGDSPGDPFVRSELSRHFERINLTNVRLDTRAADAAASGRRYVGSDTCAACHTRTYTWWLTTSHARAFSSLVQRGRQHDLDCVGCHVTGFQQAGGATLSAHEHLEGVGCESCHGPGSAHSDDPTSAHSIERAAGEEVCTRCHDLQHSDAFDYRTARTRLMSAAHGGS